MERVRSKVEAPQRASSNAAGQRLPRGRMTESASPAFPIGRQRVPPVTQSVTSAMFATPSMADSRVTRRSDSPSESSVQSPASSIFPEGSYMVLREPDPSDPFTTFNALLEGMLHTLSNPVAFASAPIPSNNGLLPTSRKAGPALAARISPSSRDAMAESFFVVPPSTNATTNASTDTRVGSKQAVDEPAPAASASGYSNKTNEELALENASLKTNLDNLARQYEQIVHERAAERELLKGSIMHLGKEVKREAERAAAQSVASLRSTSQAPSSATRMQELEGQLVAVKQELATANAAVAKYKGRYEQIRDAIKKRRAARDAQDGVAAASQGDARPETKA